MRPTTRLLDQQVQRIFSPTFPFTLDTNPYKSNKPWPPDFSTLSQKHQFRLERRFRRRSKLKYLRTGWMKGTRLAQWVGCTAVVGYAVFYMEVQQDQALADAHMESRAATPFGIIRDWCSDLYDSVWTHSHRRPNNGGSNTV